MSCIATHHHNKFSFHSTSSYTVDDDVVIGEQNMSDSEVSLHPLRSKWNMYYHLSTNKNWSFSSYVKITQFSTVEDVLVLSESLSKNIAKYCMLFIMRDGISPMWEDTKNRNGGCFSYKVSNKIVPTVWRHLTFLLCGETLMVDKKHMQDVNGITISPKRNFCVIKIWMANLKLQDVHAITEIPNLSKSGVIFKAHTPES